MTSTSDRPTGDAPAVDVSADALHHLAVIFREFVSDLNETQGHDASRRLAAGMAAADLNRHLDTLCDSPLGAEEDATVERIEAIVAELRRAALGAGSRPGPDPRGH